MKRLCLSLLLLAGCPKPPAPVADAGPGSEPDAAIDAAIDAGAPDAGPEPLRFSITLDTVDAGTFTLDGLDAGAELPQVRAVTLHFAEPLDDLRVRVMDWTDAVVPSDDEASVDGGFVYRISFLTPLKTGRGYALLLDGETKDTFRDARGAEYTELRLPFRIGGEVQPEPGAPSKKSKKKKKR
ncbi:MAG: hypothetical protein JNJ54_23395 [Myxococcaceae bacterium]|nr:hypothetical protein [Myxococcaceae bacterium]